MKKSYLLIIAVWMTCQVSAQLTPEIITAYINNYKDLAMAEMQRSGVPASITLAQGILETEAGRSNLVMRSNNHFGIKCKSSWTGEKVYHDDDAKGECFRKYQSAEDSYRDHSDYLAQTPRYAHLFKLDPADYKAWSHGIRAAGYATNPKYAYILIKYIETYSLNDYTLIAMGRITGPDMAIAAGGTGTSGAYLDSPTSNSVADPKAVDKNEVNYPLGEFRINDTKVIWAAPGTSLKDVARKYALTVDWLQEFNDLPSSQETVVNGQLLYLQRKRKQGSKEFRLFAEGDDLYSIAQEEGIRLESLLKYNQLSMEMKPAIGEKLYLKAEAPGRPRLAFAQHVN
jgi:LysM repeat protein